MVTLPILNTEHVCLSLEDFQLVSTTVHDRLPFPKTISKFNPSRIGNLLAQANARSKSFEVMLKDLIVNPLEKDTSIYNIYIYLYLYIYIYISLYIYIYIYISNIYLYIHSLPHQYIPTLSNSKSSPKWTEERCGLSKC